MRAIHHIFLTSALLAAAGTAGAQPLHILTTEVPPLAFVKDGKLQGYCVEIVEHIQRRLGERGGIAVLPWARAYHKAQVEPNTMLVCPKRSNERERMFQWVGPLLTSRTGIYVKAGSHAKIASLAEAKSLPSILVVRASYSYQNLAGAGLRNLHEVNDAASILRMLMADRAPAMMMERQELDAVLKEAGIARREVNAIYEMQSPSSNLAFSLDVPAQTVRQWQAAFDAMKKDGSYGKLHDKWFATTAGLRR